MEFKKACFFFCTLLILLESVVHLLSRLDKKDNFFFQVLSKVSDICLFQFLDCGQKALIYLISA